MSTFFDHEGRVVDGNTRAALPDHRVEVWDVVDTSGQAIAEATTDQRGGFSFSLEEAVLVATLGEVPTALFFRVFEGSTEVADTQATVIWPLDNPIHTSTIVVGPPVSRRVDGTVTDATSGAAVEATVKVFRRCVALSGISETLLGEAPTNDRGRYRVRYSTADTRPVNLIVRAVDATTGALLVESAEACRVGPVSDIGLVIGTRTRLTEVELLAVRVIAELDACGGRVESVDAAGVRLLACSLNEDARRIALLVEATKLALSIGVPRDVFYAVARHGLALDMYVLFSTTALQRREVFEEALASHTVPLGAGQTIDGIMAQLAQGLVSYAMSATSQPGKFAMRDMLNSAQVAAALHQPFLTHYVARGESDEAMWSTVAEDDVTPFTTADVKELRTAFDIAVLLQGLAPLVAEIGIQRAAGAHPTVRDLAKVERATWVQWVQVTGQPIDFPPHIAGDTEAEKLERYVDGVTSKLARMFPSEVVRRSITASQALRADTRAFLDANLELDLLNDDIDAFVSAGAAVSGIADIDKAIAETKTLQRLARISDDADQIAMLFDAGIYSADQLAWAPKSLLRNRFPADTTDATIDKLVLNARLRAGLTQMVAIASRDAHAPQYGVMAPPDGPAPAAASWSNLFGDVSYCRCEHCRSVYGPAAYFVDLMTMLDQGPIGAASNPLTALLYRRPDLDDLQLSCANTNTLIPYIDLVNEILESYVKSHFVDNPTTEITTGDVGDATSDELAAVPQRVIHEAYDVLAAAVYPMSMPFVRPLRVAREYLQQMGVSRLELLRAFHGAAGVGDDVIGYEQLGISTNRTQFFPDLTPQELPTFHTSVLPTYYGFSVPSASWGSTLAQVPEFLKRSEVTFDELTELVQLRYVQDGTAVTIQVPPQNVDCDISTMTIGPVDAACFDRMHRMIRLQRALGWSLTDLDRALVALGVAKTGSPLNRQFDKTVLAQLALFERYHQALNIPVKHVFALWSNIDTFGEDSLYQQLFLSRVLLPTLAPGGAHPFALNSNQTQLEAAATAFIGEQIPAISAALGLGEKNLRQLIEQLYGEVAVPLTIENLSTLFRYTLIADALKISISAVNALLALTGGTASPFIVGDAFAANAFIELVEQIELSEFSIGLLDYLFRHGSEVAGNLAPTEKRIDQVLTSIREALLDTAKRFAAPAEEGYDVPTARSVIGQYVTDANAAAKLLEALQMDVGMTITARETALQDSLGEVWLDYYGAATAHFVDMFGPLADPLPASETAATQLAKRTKANIKYVIDAIQGYLTPRQQAKDVTRLLSTEVDLSVAQTSALLTKHLAPLQGSAGGLLADFTALALDSITLVSRRDSFVRFFKAGKVVSTFDLVDTNLVALFVDIDDPSVGLFDLSQLPIGEPAAATPLLDVAALFVQWRGLDNAVVFSRNISNENYGLSDVLEAATPLDAAAMITAATRWPRQDAESLTSNNGFGWGGSDHDKLRRLRQFSYAMARIKPFAADASTVLTWLKPPSVVQADGIVQALRARYDKTQFLEVAKGLNNNVRDQQREALVAYLVPRLAQEGVASSNDLLGYLLIDVEMTSCMLTSRVKQAIASVQMFVQRILMGLEREGSPNSPDVSPDAIDADDWDWRKTYRIWEANRKVFLYPENWIEPDLRLDKSPFFRELEADLRRGKLTDEAVEKALGNYLYKLDEVANLEVVAHHSRGTHEDAPVDVIARTPTAPHRYFYRSFTPIDGWRSWERIDLEVESDHHLLFEMHGRKYFAWARFGEQADDDGNPFYEIGMFVSEYRNGQWLRPKAAGETIHAYPNVVESPAPRQYLFVVGDGDGGSGFVIQCFRKGRRLNDHTEQAYHDVYYDIWVNLDGFKEAYDGQFEWRDVVNAAYDVDNLSSYYNLMASPQVLDDFLNKYKFEPDELSPPNWSVRSKFHSNMYKAVPIYREYLVAHTPANIRRKIEMAAFGTTEGWEEVGAFEMSCGRLRVTQAEPVPAFISEDAADDLLAPMQLGHSGFGGPVATTPTFQYSDLRASKLTFSSAKGYAKLLKQVVGGAQVTRPGNQPGPGYFLYHHYPFFYRTNGEHYFFTPSGGVVGQDLPGEFGDSSPAWPRYRVVRTYQPFACQFIEALNQFGVGGLMATDTQSLTLDTAPNFPDHFLFAQLPDPNLLEYAGAHHRVGFGMADAYQLYNWELFFHVPLLIANRLNREQRHDAAQRWYHFIFNPMTTDTGATTKRFWQFKPLRDTDAKTNINDLIEALASPSQSPALNKDIKQQLAAWMAYPFEPHRIARVRLTAYMRTVVMKYIDNLLDWGDRLFRHDTMESINEAIQLYILAADILGKRPLEIPPVVSPDATSYAALRVKLKATMPGNAALQNVFVAAENEAIAPFYSFAGYDGKTSGMRVLRSIGVLAFCIPNNPQLLDYYARVEDRLFKIRHCLNIDGVRRQLPLFEPPIDPALLVRARAAGVDFATVLDDLGQSSSPYRFAVLLSKAQQLVGEVRSLGGALLSALEKRDAESLTRLRSSHEVALLDAVREIKKQQIREAKSAQKSLRKAKESAEARLRFYRQRTTGGVHTIAEENMQLQRIDEAQGLQTAAQSVQTVSRAFGAATPQFEVSTNPLVAPKFVWGGLHLSELSQAISGGLELAASLLSWDANRASIIAGRKRRHDDWLLQAGQADKEVKRITQDLVAAEIREAIARTDLENHDRQRENAREVYAFLRDKFTNEELYSWMVDKLGDVYFQAYNLAYDMAKRAERAYGYELAIEGSVIINFGYWDSLKEGLLAGEQLSLDLQRLDVAHTTANRREYELNKSISLVRLEPAKLMQLRATGSTEFELPESLFQLDYASHYMRRIKAVRLTIPVVAGPHTSVNCKLTQLSSSIRIKPVIGADPTDDLNVKHRYGANDAVCTSNAQSDGGLFELSFQDPRYLPFEGTGVASTWRIELDPEANAFDLATLSDVVMQLSYTAREGGEVLKDEVKALLTTDKDLPRAARRLFSLRGEFSSQWNAFINERDNDDNHIMTFSMAGKMPYLYGAGAIQIEAVSLALAVTTTAPMKVRDSGDGYWHLVPPGEYAAAVAAADQAIIAAGGDTDAVAAAVAAKDAIMLSNHVAPNVTELNLTTSVDPDAGNWTFAISDADLVSAELDDIFFIVEVARS